MRPVCQLMFFLRFISHCHINVSKKNLQIELNGHSKGKDQTFVLNINEYKQPTGKEGKSI